MPPPYDVRAVRAHEWREARALRLAALSDEAAAVAFLTTYAEAAGRSDEFWADQVARSSTDAGPDAPARQFVALHADGTWVGSVVALADAAETPSASNVVAVYLRPGHRGLGVLQRLLDEAAGWLRERGLGEAAARARRQRAGPARVREGRLHPDRGPVREQDRTRDRDGPPAPGSAVAREEPFEPGR
ncbi:GNAT family N-acetyltransferase [Blastococcus sp. SYSU D01042]